MLLRWSHYRKIATVLSQIAARAPTTCGLLLSREFHHLRKSAPRFQTLLCLRHPCSPKFTLSLWIRKNHWDYCDMWYILPVQPIRLIYWFIESGTTISIFGIAVHWLLVDLHELTRDTVTFIKLIKVIQTSIIFLTTFAVIQKSQKKSIDFWQNL